MLIFVANNVPKEENKTALETNSDAVAFLRERHIVAASRIESDTEEIYAELEEDANNVFGSGACSIMSLTIHQFFAIKLVGKDGFDDVHYVRFSASVHEIMDGKPRVKTTVTRSDEAAYNKMKNRKVSFEYDRYTLMSNGDDRLLAGMKSLSGGMVFKKYEANYLQPTVQFFKTLKSALR
jgi:hypothetical protein